MRLKTFVKRLLHAVLPSRVLFEFTVVYWRLRNRFGGYEPECALLPLFVRAGDCVLDLGVNMGQYAFRLARLVGFSGRVVGFEASRSTIALARRILPYGNIDLSHVAIGSSRGVVTLRIISDDSGLVNTGLTAVARTPVEDGAKSESVPCSTLDHELRSREKPIRFIKCDVEGYEVEVLRGGLALLERDRPIVLCEINSAENYRDVAHLLAPFEYRVMQLQAGRLAAITQFTGGPQSNYVFMPDGFPLDESIP